MNQKAPTVKDVAQKAGVSVATVSRVMNNKGYLSDEIKKQVKAAMDELGYVPNQIARSFFKKQTNSIGVIVPTITNPFFGELVYHIEKFAEKQGFKVFLCNSLNDPNIEKNYLKMLLENQVDGIIVGTHNEELEEYSTPNIPIIAVERFLDNKRIPTVCSDNYEGGKLATEYLLAQGCQNIFCFSGESKLNYPANDRRIAFEETIRPHQPGQRIVDIVSSFDIVKTTRTIEETFAKHPTIDGVFATDDVIATLVMKEIQKRGLVLNQEVHIVGFDGTDLMRHLFPELVTIKQPIDLLAKYAVTHLLSLMAQEQVPKMVMLPIELVRQV